MAYTHDVSFLNHRDIFSTQDAIPCGIISGLKQFPLVTVAPEDLRNNKVLFLTNPYVMNVRYFLRIFSNTRTLNAPPPDRLQEFFFQVKSTWDLKPKPLEMTLNKSKHFSLAQHPPLLPEYLLLQSSLSSKWNFNPKLYKHSRRQNKYTL